MKKILILSLILVMCLLQIQPYTSAIAATPATITLFQAVHFGQNQGNWNVGLWKYNGDGTVNTYVNHGGSGAVRWDNGSQSTGHGLTHSFILNYNPTTSALLFTVVGADSSTVSEVAISPVVPPDAPGPVNTLNLIIKATAGTSVSCANQSTMKNQEVSYSSTTVSNLILDGEALPELEVTASLSSDPTNPSFTNVNQVDISVPTDRSWTLTGDISVQFIATDMSCPPKQWRIGMPELNGKYMESVTISASTGANGSITPSGNVGVEYGSNQSFIITPDYGYKVGNVLVDGVSVGVITGYTFPNVITNHTIEATFAINNFTVSASVAGSGQAFPVTQTVDYGGQVSITVNPDEGCSIISITDNGVAVPVSNPYVITNVTENHNVVFSVSSNNYIITLVSPSGTVYMTVEAGVEQDFEFEATPGYRIHDVVLDGVSKGPINTLILTNIQADHVVEVYFCPRWDVNGDYIGDVMDIVSIGLHWGEQGTAGWIAEDANEDGSVDVLDVVLIGLHWQEMW
ncbi:MAG: hypothetical protein JW967_11000 [Dehalococcoidales bacterium]|nr:hypothetical protein [Dehalococcoidales bacterium]